jgi:D-alanine-D-alanine ligase
MHTRFDPARTCRSTDLVTQRYDRVWIALHGPGGEDGTLQGALEFLGLPYTGSGVHGLRDRHGQAAHQALAAAVGVATAESMVLTLRRRPAARARAKLGLPMIVKPATQGSSVGMSKVERAEDLARPGAAAAAVDRSRVRRGLDHRRRVHRRDAAGRALPSIRIETPRLLRLRGEVLSRRHAVPLPVGPFAPEAEKHLASLALAAFEAAGAEGWGRVDFMSDRTGRPLLLEINTVPGMTDHSLVPMAARAVGIDFDELCWQVLETSFVRRPTEQQTGKE